MAQPARPHDRAHMAVLRPHRAHRRVDHRRVEPPSSSR
jgi:hypothetical protein